MKMNDDLQNWNAPYGVPSTSMDQRIRLIIKNNNLNCSLPHIDLVLSDLSWNLLIQSLNIQFASGRDPSFIPSSILP